ncbi:MAG TPA: hypothetical protein VIJ11_09265 [Galbitalea sp.]
MIGLGIFGLINGDFAEVWQFVPASVPGRQVMAYTSAALMLVCGIGLLSKHTDALAARVLFWYLALLVLLLKLPVVVKHPLVEVAWQSMSEIVVVFTGGWVLFAADGRAVRSAQLVFGAALIPLGLAHFFYLNMTAPLVPAWLPYHTGWAYLTGAAQIAAGLGVLLGICARLAAALEAAMLTAFTVLVWIPAILAAPTSRPSWSELTISWAVSAGAWVVAASIPKKRPATAIQSDITSA